ncbi:MAG TPA: hypothetical protein VFB63_29915 [Bryobacteraceae bacterium]|jgi:hypothetical protein|nr:hypothetical protein [Bryobacteraceae bacterium]
MEPIDDMIRGLDDQQLQLLAAQANRELRERSRRIDINEITAEKMQDPKFAAAVRAEVDRTLREV